MMHRKFYKVALLSFLVFLVPVKILAFDQDSLLNSLIKYSYPEVKVLENNNTYNKTEDNNINDKELEIQNVDTNQNINKNQDENQQSDKKNQYINVYVGKENIPVAKKLVNKSEVSLDNNIYSNNLRVTNDKPNILIYHTHSCETYLDSPEGNYHSEDKENSVMSVGCLLTNELSNLGWGVIHSTKYHDSPSYNNSYLRSSETIKSVMDDYSSVNVTIDLHRDGVNIQSEAAKKNIHNNYTTTIDGQSVAKFFFVVGARNSSVEKVKKLAEGITEYAKTKYPDLIMPVVVKPYGRFNQSICENALLVEVGSNGTTTKEAQASTKYLAEILDGYFKENNI